MGTTLWNVTYIDPEKGLIMARPMECEERAPVNNAIGTSEEPIIFTAKQDNLDGHAFFLNNQFLN